MTIILLLIAAIVALAADSGGSQTLDAMGCDEGSGLDIRGGHDSGTYRAGSGVQER